MNAVTSLISQKENAQPAAVTLSDAERKLLERIPLRQVTREVKTIDLVRRLLTTPLGFM